MSPPRVRLCANLRWKGLLGTTFPDEAALLRAFTEADCTFSCLMTVQPFGPDGALVEPSACGEGRTCFRPSAREPRRYDVS